jgi:DNA-binding transcriptional MerR regulator
VVGAMLDIGEVTRATGLAPSALRFYERRGLLRSAARNGLRRAYEPDVIDRLGLIVAARDVGFSVREIGELLDANDELSLRALLAAKVAELDDRIHRLVAMRDRLSHGVSCESPSLVDCPYFKRGLRAVLPVDPRQVRAAPAATERGVPPSVRWPDG